MKNLCVALFVCALTVAVATPASGQCMTDPGQIFGNWNDPGFWTNCFGGVPSSSTDAVIVDGTIVVVDQVTGNACKNLTVENGAQLYASTSTPRVLDVYGSSVTIDGTIGDGANGDGIFLRFYTNGAVTLSGGGTIDLLKLRKEGSNSTALTISSDVNIWGTGASLYNFGTGAVDFDLTVAPSTVVDVKRGDVSLDGSSGADADELGGTWDVQGTLLVGGKLYLQSDNTTNPGVLSIDAAGAVTAAEAITTSGTSQFSVDMSAGGTLTFTSGNFGDLAAGSVFTFGTDAVVDFARADGSAQVVNHPDASTRIGNVVRLSGSGTKQLAASTSFGTAGTLVMGGTATLDVNGQTYANDGALTYAGDVAQYTGSEWPAASGPASVSIDNTHGVTLTGNRSLSDALTFVNGYFYTNDNVLTLGSAGSVSGESSGKSLIGYVTTTRTVSGAEDFGNLGFSFAAGGIDPMDPVTLTRVTGDNGVTKVGGNESISCRFDADYSGTDNGSFSKELTISWLANYDNGKTLQAMEMWRFDGSGWVKQSESPQDASGSRVITETVTSFSSYTVSDAFNVLPVELASFEATADRDDVVLRWTTASETNNAGFEVQTRPVEQEEWTTASFVEGVGTTLEQQAYSERIEDLLPGRHVFRLKQVDFDGTFEYGPEVEVAIAVPQAAALSTAYPNPFNPTTSFTLSVARAQDVRVEVYDVTGRRVALLFDGAVAAHTTRAFTFDAASLPSGLYLYRATGETFVESRTMLLQK